MPDPILRIRLTADDKASKAVVNLAKNAAKAAGDIKRQLVTALKTAGIAAGALVAAATAAGFALKKTADATRDAALEADTLAKQFNLTVEAASGYVRVAELADVKSNELVAAFQRLSRGIDGVRTGTDPTSGAFRDLGIEADVLEGKVRGPEEALLAIADRFRDLPDGAAKVNLAFGALGDSGKALIPLLNQGSDAIREQLGLVKELGATIDDEAVRAAAEYDKQLKILGLAFEGLRNEIGKEVLPIITDLVAGFLDFFRRVRPEIVAFIRFVPAAFKLVVQFMRDAFERGGLLEIVGQILTGILEVVKAFGTSLLAIAPKLWEPLVQGLASVGGRILAEFQDGVVNPIIDLVNDTAIKIQEGLLGNALGAAKEQFEDLSKRAATIERALAGGSAVLLTRDVDTGQKLDQARIATADELQRSLENIRQTQAQIIQDAGGDFTFIDRVDISKIRAASRELGTAASEGFGEAFDAFGVELDRALAGIGEGLAEKAPDLVKLFENLKSVWVETRANVEVVNDELDGMSENIDKGTVAAKTFGEGFVEQLKEIEKGLNDMGARGAQVANELIDVLAGGLEDRFFSAIDNGFQDVGEQFKLLVADILKGLAKIAARQAIASAFGAGLGAIPLAQGGVIPGGRSVPSFQDGGIATEPIFRVGDRRDRKPEAVVPLPNGRSIPVEFAGGAPGGGAMIVHVNLTANVRALDAKGVDEVLFGRKQTIRNLVEDGLRRSGAFRSRVGRAR